MSNKFKTGDRVHYRVYPSGEPDTGMKGTVVAVGEPSQNLPAAGTNYTVKWDHVDYTRYTPTVYKAQDLTHA
jgi:hypothetical protein